MELYEIRKKGTIAMNPDLKRMLTSVSKVAINGGIVFAAFTIAVTICFYFFGSTNDEQWSFVDFVRGLVGIPAFVFLAA
jgi:hypothetical protein